MTKKEKQLLLIDLCARLLYGVKIHINSCIEEQNQMQLFDVNLEAETIGVRNEKWTFRGIPIIDDEDETKMIKPYLRSLSNITEEEKIELCIISYAPDEMKTIDEKLYVIQTNAKNATDYFNEHHFDYRGLIPMGLALEAPEDMYKTEQI